MLYQRSLEKTIMNVSQSYPVVLLTGPRQVGKTTLLKLLSDENRNYVTLDDPEDRLLANENPKLFFEKFPPPILIDEVQYAPGLLIYIKMMVDEHKTKGEFWLTGSQLFHLMKNVSESLAGRVAVLNMHGLSYAELTHQIKGTFIPDLQHVLNDFSDSTPIKMTPLYERIIKGSMPAVYKDELDPNFYFASYVNTYIQRDIRDLVRISDEQAFIRFLKVCAAKTSQMVNYTDMAQEVSVSAPTIKKWISLLVTSGVIILLEPYFNNALKRIIKSPVLYFMDTGLCAYLNRFVSVKALETGTMAGAFFENYVVSEIIKRYSNAGMVPPIYYYRDKDKQEIDLIIDYDNVLYPIEIKKSINPKLDAIKHFGVLKKTGRLIGNGWVISMTEGVIPIDEKNYMMPIWAI